MDSSRVFYADYHAIFRFFTTLQSFDILSVKMTKMAILTYFQVPLNIKQQYLKSQYFVDVIENSFLFDLTKKLIPYVFIYVYYPLESRSFSFLVNNRVLIELKTSGNLKIKEEAVFYYVNKIF